MPELPEVEMARRLLEAGVLHQKIRAIDVRDSRILNSVSAQDLEGALAGRRLSSAIRHGKRLFLQIDSGLWLALHLGLTGWQVILEKGSAEPRHTRLRIDFEGGAALAFDDLRIFGEVGLTESPQEFLARRGIGPDALQMEKEAFLAAMSGRKGKIKPALLDQGLIAGLGNLYADEALFQSGICPQARSLKRERLEALYSAIQEVLRTSLASNADFEKLPNSYLLPHRRPGEACPWDGTALQRIKIAGRTSYYCPQHQKK
ncbi:MAG: Fpg/Nei family DNA glycosylase [Methanothrix sp.]